MIIWLLNRIVKQRTNLISGKTEDTVEELFNIAWDLSERTNLIHEYLEKIAELRKVFASFYEKE